MALVSYLFKKYPMPKTLNMAKDLVVPAFYSQSKFYLAGQSQEGVLEICSMLPSLYRISLGFPSLKANIKAIIADISSKTHILNNQKSRDLLQSKIIQVLGQMAS